MKKTLWLVVVGLCALSFGIGHVLAEEEVATPEMPKPAWTKLGEEHKELAKLAGEWAVTGKFWMAPDAEPMVSTGMSTHKLVLNGQFLEQHYTAKAGEMTMTGIGYIGYDTVNKKWVTVWMDNHSPYLYVFRGASDGDGVWQMMGREPNMMTGAMQDSKVVMRWTGDDSYVLELHGPGPDGKMHRFGEMTYTRKK